MTRWVAMVQKEVGERLAAAPGDARLRRAVACSRSSPATCGSCARSRARVFHPVPNVDSVLVGLDADAARPRRPALRALVAAAFAHRRKALARSLVARPGARRRGDRASAPAPRCATLGHPADARAERLVARGLPRAARRTLARDRAPRARAGEDQPLPVRRPARARATAATSSSASCSRSRSPTSCARAGATAAPTRSSARASTGPNLAAAALARLPRARPAGTAPPLRLDDRQAHPGRRRAWAAARPTPPRRCGSPPRAAGAGDDACCAEIAAHAGRRRARPRSAPGAGWRPGRGSGCRRCRAARARTASLVLPVDAALLDARRLRARPTASARRATAAELERGARSALRGRRRARRAPRYNDLQPRRPLAVPGHRRRARATRAAAGADEVLVSGSGPTVLGLFARERRSAQRARVAAAELAGRPAGARSRPSPCPAGWRSRRTSSHVRHTAGRRTMSNETIIYVVAAGVRRPGPRRLAGHVRDPGLEVLQPLVGADRRDVPDALRAGALLVIGGSAARSSRTTGTISVAPPRWG